MFEVDDGSGPARVLVKKTTGWTRPALTRGQPVLVVGVVSQSGDLYRILPRLVNDIALDGSVAGAAVGRTSLSGRARSVASRSRADTAAPRQRDENLTAAVPASVLTEQAPEETLSSSFAQPLSTQRLPLPTILMWSAAGVLGMFRVALRPPIA